jgi:hypothetical protein
VGFSENVDTVNLGHEPSFMAAWSETQTCKLVKRSIQTSRLHSEIHDAALLEYSEVEMQGCHALNKVQLSCVQFVLCGHCTAC